MIRMITLLAALIFAQSAQADCTKHYGEDNGFTSTAFFTTDMEWDRKWITPSDTIADIACTDVLPINQFALLLVTFSDATLVDGMFQIDCSIAIIEPGPEYGMSGPNNCAEFGSDGHPTSDYFIPITTLVGIVGEPGELGECYTIQYTISDRPTGRSVTHDICAEVVLP
jgi:hypothetical protein